MSDDFLFEPITRLAPRIERKELSPVELAEACLARIERLNPALGAYITVTARQALAEARSAAEEIARGAYRGPLHGIPVGVKDQFWTAGVRTTAGSKLLQDFVPQQDATVIRRLREAGTVLVGKQNMAEFALGGTRRHPFGEPRNPWDPQRIPGHSSSGSGVALAAGLCSAAVGEDTGGSIRNPAAFCNLVGLRPTWGRVSRYGMITGSWSLDTASPIARTPEDCALMLGAIAGRDPNDPTSSRRPVPDYRAGIHGGIAGLRVGVVQQLTPGPGFHPDVVAAFQSSLKVLETLGARVEEVSLPLVSHAAAVFVAICDTDAAGLHHDNLRTRSAEYDSATRNRLAAAALVSAGVYNLAQRARGALRRQVLEALTRVDVLAAATATGPAPIITEYAQDLRSEADVVARQFGTRAFSNPFSLAALPALSTPCGFTAEGLPIGLQLAGRPFDEATLLRAAAAFDAETGWTKRHPEL